jgi:hypothetical protein
MVKFEDLTSIKQEIIFSMTQNIFTHITTVQETWHNFTVKLAYQYCFISYKGSHTYHETTGLHRHPANKRQLT